VFDGRGRFKGYRGVGRDVTAQKRAEQMLRLEHQVAHALSGEHEPNEAVRAVIRAVCEVEGWACGRYFRLDEASGLLRFQDAWCVADPVVRQFVERSRTIALRPGEGLSGNFWQTDAQDRFTEMVHGPNYVDTVAGAGEAGWGELRGMFQARAPFRDFEFGRPWPDGSIRYFSVSGEPRFAAEGPFLGYRGVGR